MLKVSACLVLTVLALPGSAPADEAPGERDVTLYSPQTKRTLILEEADDVRTATMSGRRKEYFRQPVSAFDDALVSGCRLQVAIKEILVWQLPPTYEKHYLLVYNRLGTNETNDFCQRPKYSREVPPRKLLEVVGLTWEGVGANDRGGNNEMHRVSYPKKIDDPVRVKIGRAVLELTVTESSRQILVRLISVDPEPRKAERREK